MSTRMAQKDEVLGKKTSLSKKGEEYFNVVRSKGRGRANANWYVRRKGGKTRSSKECKSVARSEERKTYKRRETRGSSVRQAFNKQDG